MIIRIPLSWIIITSIIAGVLLGVAFFALQTHQYAGTTGFLFFVFCIVYLLAWRLNYVRILWKETVERRDL